ncbi:effector-associated domain EAD1-containing protein, partial [Scytonema sp. PCC 10023]|uniref:effector-associated domain EAD1-containing protein n=1 Tax=Scytonema sp. PCC 10023 TaxID=1680591 RepID=UPI0039C5B009
MELSGQQCKKLQDALIAAFPTKFQFEQMLLFELDLNLDSITNGTNLQEIVFHLIKTARAEGWVEALLKAALKSNPKNLQLQTIAQEVLEKPQHSISQQTTTSDSPFQAPPLPYYFVERPEYSEDLKNRLLTQDRSTLVITAIHGLGSVGKSTLAAALAHDKDVQAHFCDGILWATLGQQPDVLSLLSGWVQALRDYDFKPTSIEAATSHLRTLLYDKAVLLVVDDAWETKHAQAFNIGGSRCQVLVTTREGAIADALGASTYSLDVMEPSQAMELLTKKLGRDLKDAERQSAADLALAVGYLPLALELAAAEIASGTSWVDLLQDLQLEVARLKTFDRPESEEITDEASLKRLSLTASLNLSVQRLSKEKRLYFSWLGVLPEDATITKAMTATLWDMNERDASKTLQYLRNKALLLLGVSLLDGTPTYRLHDLFHDLARNLLTAPSEPKDGNLPGLGLTFVNAHAIFLEKYRPKTKKDLWHTLPNDGYIHQHLVWHFEKAERKEEIHQLLWEESETKLNGWYEVRERLGQTTGYLTDIARAWQVAKYNYNEQTLPRVVGLQCRYALIQASLNSLAANLPINLLVALVKKGEWTPEKGLVYVLQTPDSKQRINSLLALVDYLPQNLKKRARQEILAAAQATQSEEYRATALAALADKLPEVLPEALAAARAIQSEQYRATALANLADKLPEVLPEALAAARAIQSKRYFADILKALADKLPEVLPEALAAAQAIPGENSRTDALRALADKLPEVLPEALAAARAIQSKSSRADALRSLADKLPEVLPEALAAARAIESEEYRATALANLADKLPEMLPEALAAARAIQDEKCRASVLSNLANKLPPELLPEALAAVRAIKSEEHRATALANLADKLPEMLPEALAAARAIQDEKCRASVLSNLANKLPPELLPEALAAVRAIQDKKYRASVLNTLADKLPTKLLPEALAAVRAIQDEISCVNILNALVNQPSTNSLSQALEAASAIEDESDRADALTALADKLPPELLPQALEAALAIKSESERTRALSALASKLPPELLPQALEAALAIKSESERTRALSALASKLPPELLPQALEGALAIKDESNRADALSALADKLPPELLPQALEAALAIKPESERARALISALANKLPPELLPQALEAALAIK